MKEIPVTVKRALELVGLFFGHFKNKVTGQPVLAGAVKVTVIGTLAAAATFFAAKLIGG